MKKKKIIGAGAVAVLVLLIVTAACMTGNSDAKEKQAKDRQQSITAEQPKKDKKLPTKLVTTDKKTASKASTEKKESESGQQKTAEQTAEKAAKAETTASQTASKSTSADTASKQQPQASKTSKPSKQSHTHAWQEQTAVVHHPATGHEEQVLVKAAWTEEIPIYETRAWECCNTCGADITANPGDHIEKHMLAGEGGSAHTEYEQVVVGKNVVEHPAEYTTQWVQDSGAWDETVVTGYRCSCGATK